MIRTTAASLLLATTLTSGATVLASADAASAAGSGSSSSPAAARAAAYTVTAGVNRTDPLVGSTVKVKGAVTPAAPGATVRLQVKYAGQKWKTVDRAALSRSSRYKFKDEVKTVRERKYRVVKPADRRHAGGKATTGTVTVYGWRDLTSITPVLRQNVTDAPVTINAVPYGSSLRGSGTAATGQVDYNLNRDCKQLDAVFGIDDASPAASSASLTLTTDGATRHTGSYTLTQGQRVVTDLTGVFRLTVTTSQTGGGVPAVGDPKVLCSF